MFLYQYSGIIRQAYSKWLVKENPYNAYNKNLAHSVLEIHNAKPEIEHRVITDTLRQKWTTNDNNTIGT